MVPGEGVEPSHPLGRQILSLLRLPFRHPGLDGAGEGNRTLVASLEGWSSAIELRPRKKRPYHSVFALKSQGDTPPFFKKMVTRLPDHDFFLGITNANRIFITSDKERDGNGSESANIHATNDNPPPRFTELGCIVN
jgi:hypothetical protein